MAYKYSATCHTKCFWLNNLWMPGEVYEGNEEPIKHFNQSGKAPDLPPPDAGSDKRSNVQLRAALKKHPFNFTAPTKWIRKQLWAKLQELELAASKDALLSEDEKFFAKCGFQGKSRAGVVVHERSCVKCNEIKKEPQDKVA